MLFEIPDWMKMSESKIREMLENSNRWLVIDLFVICDELKREIDKHELLPVEARATTVADIARIKMGLNKFFSACDKIDF